MRKKWLKEIENKISMLMQSFKGVILVIKGNLNWVKGFGVLDTILVINYDTNGWTDTSSQKD